MDIFKLLSRSSKTSQTPQAQTLPSSGAAANPQLFGHSENHDAPSNTKSSRKRKRGQDAVIQPTALPAELDFFSDAPRKPKAVVGDTSASKKKTQNGAHEEANENMTGDAKASRQAETPTMDEDERKRILRSHKLKIVVLNDFAPPEETMKPEKKEKKKSSKKRKKEEDAKEKAKKNKQQLFPEPLITFGQLKSRYGISRRLAENIKNQGYMLPTEVQLGALPLLLGEGLSEAEPQNGDTKSEDNAINLLTVAPTGSGKTVAFLIPIINKLLSQNKHDSSIDAPGPRAVVIAPTRELASQIVNEARKLAQGTKVKAALMKKGMEVVERLDEEAIADADDKADSEDEVSEDAGSESADENQPARKEKQKRRRAELVKAGILVATPLALVNALKDKNGTVATLPSVQHLVLDEADVLLDPMFRDQTLGVWNACTHPNLRVGLWSATMGANIEDLAINTMNDRWNVISSSTTSLPPRARLIRLVVGLKDTAIPNITHKLTYAATEQGKLLGLRQLLHPTATPSSEASTSLRPPFLVFTQTIPRAIALHSELLYDIPPEAGGSSRIAVLHAELNSAARENIMTNFRKGEIWVLITTDLLARGVDFRGLNGVVNYDVPNSAAAYVHRVGRTGRAGRAGGVAVTFYTQEDIPYIKNIANVIRASEKLRSNGSGGEEASVQQWLLDALPTPTKRDKQTLKKRGVESRRNVGGKEGSRMRISTKSGFERRVENRKKGAKLGSQRREQRGGGRIENGVGSESEFEGFGA